MSERSDIPPGTNSVLFVCLGNICRSPLAEGIFIDLARRGGVEGRFKVDSCGTGSWHVGNRPDRRALDVARRHNIELPGIARQFDARRDPQRFDLLIPMDGSNARALLDAGLPHERVRLMRSFDPAVSPGDEAPDVPDPYYGDGDGFETVFQMLERSCAALLRELLSRAPDVRP